MKKIPNPSTASTALHLVKMHEDPNAAGERNTYKAAKMPAMLQIRQTLRKQVTLLRNTAQYVLVFSLILLGVCGYVLYMAHTGNGDVMVAIAMTLMAALATMLNAVVAMVLYAVAAGIEEGAVKRMLRRRGAKRHEKP